ncbi:MAG: hypothetical protein ACXWH7_07265, partial [Thermoanaerobaculia bacterium]
MKIFQVLEFNQFNTGSVHQMFQAATGLRERGHEVTIVSKPDATLEARAREDANRGRDAIAGEDDRLRRRFARDKRVAEGARGGEMSGNRA